MEENEKKCITLNFTWADIQDMQQAYLRGENDQLFNWEFNGITVIITVGDEKVN